MSRFINLEFDGEAEDQSQGETQALAKDEPYYLHEAQAALYLSDTLEWLNLWQYNANNEQWFDSDFSAKQDHDFPQP